MRLSVTSIVILVLSATLLNSVRAQEAQPQVLKLGETVKGELKGGESHSYSKNLETGQYLHLSVKQKGIDFALKLYGPAGDKLQEVDSPNGTWGPELLFAIAESSGTYRLEIISADKNATAGSYEIKLLEVRPAVDNDKKRIDGVRSHIAGVACFLTGTEEGKRCAIKKFEEAKLHQRAAEDKKIEAQVIHDLGYVYYELGDQQAALKYYNDALPISRAVEDKQNEGNILLDIGASYYKLGEYQKAIKFYSDAVPLLRAVDDKRLEASAYNNISAVYQALGQLDKVLVFQNKSLPIFREINDKDSATTLLVNMGFFNYALGEPRQAIASYQASLPIIRASGNKSLEGILLVNIGAAYDALGEQLEALKYYEEALPILRSAGDKHKQGAVLNNIAAAHYKAGSRQNALTVSQEALNILRDVGDLNGEGKALNNIGNAYSDLGQRDLSLEKFIEAIIILRRVGDKRNEANTLEHLSKLYFADNPRLAILFAKKSVNYYQDLRSNIKGLNKSLQQAFLKSIEVSYRNLAIGLISQGRLAEAQQVLNEFKDQQFFDFEQQINTSSLTLTPREAEADAQFDRLINDIVQIHREEDASRNKEKPKCETCAGISLPSMKLVVAKNGFNAFMTETESEFKSMPEEKEITSKIDDYKDMQNVLRHLSNDTGEKTVAVYTLLGKNEFRALLITTEGIDSITYPIKEAELNQKVLQFWKLLQSPDLDPRPLASDLYKIVFAPLASKLPKDTRTILWSLDGSLRYVPMAALYDGQNYLIEKFQNVLFTRANNNQLTRKVSLDWIGTGLGSTKSHTVDLPEGKIKFEPLGQVQFEMGQIFKQADSKGLYDGDLLLDDKFTKASMLAALNSHRPLVHIASHFRFKPGNEARSFLLLGDGDIFTLDAMKLEHGLFDGVELLTLSACQTASQLPDANGREVDAVAELAQRLGAGAVLASLWDINDISSGALMRQFYQNYSGKDRGTNRTTKAGALQQAQLSLLTGQVKQAPFGNKRSEKDAENLYAEIKVDRAYEKKFMKRASAPLAHPFYWAPFVIFGNFK